MSNQKINPPEMFDSLRYAFSHAVVAEAGRLVHMAGQVAWDANHVIVAPGDLAGQAAQTLKNVRSVLAACGAEPKDVVRLRIYVVDHKPEKLDVIVAALNDFYGGELPAANTLIGVQALALPEFLIEIEATAHIA
ncbi:MAG: RidA family protein [Sphingomonadales bacterium]